VATIAHLDVLRPPSPPAPLVSAAAVTGPLPPPRIPHINPWFIAATVMLATFMEVLDTSVANVALPHIAGTVGATNEESTWVLTAYLVANAVVLPMSGWFSSLFGRKRFYLTCVALFTVSSALCGLAPSLGALIFFRILQGLGGGALQPISQAILRETFPLKKQGMAMAFFGVGVVFAPVIGPTLGGWITDNYTWRWIFLINIPVGVLSIALTMWLVHDPHYLVRRSLDKGLKIDYWGLGLLATGLGALEIMLDEGQRKDWFSSGLIVWSCIFAAVALVSVVFWELKHKDPVIELHLLKDRNFAVSVFSMFALGFVLYASTMTLPLFMQVLLGYNATRSGLALSPGGLAIMFMMPLVGFLVNRVQPRWLVIAGLLISAAGLFQMSRFNLQVDFAHLVGSRIVQSLGLAFLFVPINAMAFYYISRPMTGYATGLMNLARNIGGSTGIALVTTLIARRQQFHQNMLVSHATPFDRAYTGAIDGMTHLFMARGWAPADAVHRAQAMYYGMVQQQAAVLAFMDSFRMLALIFVGLIPFMFLMRATRPHKSELHFD
jgi:DHA2 family multidrug resistance protein